MGLIVSVILAALHPQTVAADQSAPVSPPDTISIILGTAPDHLFVAPRQPTFTDQLTALHRWQSDEVARQQRAWADRLAQVASRVVPTGSYINDYAFGNCTYYVASRIAVPGDWGNADTWAAAARNAGWTVSVAPVAGAIAATAAGYFGHVAIVEAVNGNGLITISEMNYAGGFDRVDQRVTSAAEFDAYIY